MRPPRLGACKRGARMGAIVTPSFAGYVSGSPAGRTAPGAMLLAWTWGPTMLVLAAARGAQAVRVAQHIYRDPAGTCAALPPPPQCATPLQAQTPFTTRVSATLLRRLTQYV